MSKDPCYCQYSYFIIGVDKTQATHRAAWVTSACLAMAPDMQRRQANRGAFLLGFKENLAGAKPYGALPSMAAL